MEPKSRLLVAAPRGEEEEDALLAVAVRVKLCVPSGKPKAMKDKSLQGLGSLESSCEDAGTRGRNRAHTETQTARRHSQ